MNASVETQARPSTALVAVSGGRDSVVLLHWLLEQGWHRRLVVCHLNHGLRGRASGQDAVFVRRLAAGLGVECVVEKVDVEALATAEGCSLETAGRRARWSFFEKVARRRRTEWVYLGHHGEDQAETVLAQLCRGAGLKGLGGMREVQRLESGLVLRRPLLGWRRRDIDAYVAERGLRFREDASNASAEHRRNRLRSEVLPLLDEIFQRDVSERLAAAAALAGRDEAVLEGWVGEFLEVEAGLVEGGALRLSPEVKALPDALLDRLLRRWLREVGGLGEIGQRHTAAVRGLLRERDPARVMLPGGVMVGRKKGRLWVEQIR
ncbi:MAG: tRNA lysidine(34) synthetase TilS [Verrucomicrobiales bacterium]|nr:tRNA lysidine(34) synthetase TilS [Verrucomicrobiales bacterium]